MTSYVIRKLYFQNMQLVLLFSRNSELFSKAGDPVYQPAHGFTLKVCVV